MSQAAGVDSGGSVLQNPKVQIAIIVAGLIALGVVIYLLFFSSPTGSTSTASSTPATMPGVSADAGLNAPGMDPALATPGMAGGYPGGAMGAAPGMPGVPGMPGAGAPSAGATPKEAPAKPQSPGVPTRKNAFAETREIKEVLNSIPPPLVPPTLSAPHNLYAELHTPKPPEGVSDQELEGPPVPPMRVAGIVQGTDQLSAMIQMGDVFMQVTPGNMIPENNPVYRVERIEPNKVILSRRWEIGDRKGVQWIEVALANAPRTASAGPAMGGGYPGGAMGGYPGGAMGGYPGGGASGAPPFAPVP